MVCDWCKYAQHGDCPAVKKAFRSGTNANLEHVNSWCDCQHRTNILEEENEDQSTEGS